MVVLNRLLLLFVSLAMVTPGARAQSPIPGPIAADLVRVIDGDTVKVSAQIWIDQFVTVSVRLKGVDAPELFRPQCEAERERARDAKAFVEAMLGAGAVTLLDISHDKYGGRVDARIETAGGDDVGAALIDQGLAVAAGAADPWCR